MQLLNAVKARLRESGIEVRKAPRDFLPLPVFDLAACAVMRATGRPLQFIQVGANDGVYSDPIRRYVEKDKWRGILIEPQPDMFERLQANYAGYSEQLIFENLAISSSGKNLVLYRVPNIDTSDQFTVPRAVTITSTNPKVVARQAGIAESELVKLTVPSVTLNEIVMRRGYEKFDVLQIDVEGYDFQVLQTLDLTRYRPAIVQFEHGHLSVGDVVAAGKFLTENRYCLYFGGHESDSVAMSEEAISLVGAGRSRTTGLLPDSAGRAGGAKEMAC